MTMVQTRGACATGVCVVVAALREAMPSSYNLDGGTIGPALMLSWGPLPWPWGRLAGIIHTAAESVRVGGVDALRTDDALQIHALQIHMHRYPYCTSDIPTHKFPHNISGLRDPKNSLQDR